MTEFEWLVKEVTEKVLRLLKEQESVTPIETRKQRYTVIGPVTESLETFAKEKNWSLSQEHSNNHEGIIVSELSLARLVRVSQLLSDDEEEATIVHYLLEKQPVYVLTDNRQYQKYLRTSYFATQKHLIQCEEKWQEFGATFISSKKENHRKKTTLLTKEKIEKLALTGEKTISVPSGTVVTPLAKDAIRENELTLVYTRKEG